MSVELDLTLECGHVLTVDLIGQSPEGTLPDHAGLGVLEAKEVLVVNARRRHAEVEVRNVEPEGHHTHGRNS